jgi:hypothetical protein
MSSNPAGIIVALRKNGVTEIIAKIMACDTEADEITQPFSRRTAAIFEVLLHGSSLDDNQHSTRMIGL